MSKVTRTVKVTAVRHNDNGNVVTQVFPKMPIAAAKTLMAAMNITEYEVGYMPVTYEMDEETFLTRASMKTKVEDGKIYAKKEECPNTTVVHNPNKTTG